MWMSFGLEDRWWWDLAIGLLTLWGWAFTS